MGLDNIQLSSKVIEDLYGDSLISLENDQPKSTHQGPKIPDSLGDNKRHILILIEAADQKFLPEADLLFLTNILKACDLTLADVSIVNMHQQRSLDYQRLTDIFLPELVLFFGVTPQSIGYPVRIPQYKVQEWNKQKLILSVPLQLLQSEVEQKKLFWNSLRTVFNK